MNSDEKVWALLSKGDLSGLEMNRKKEFSEMLTRVQPKSVLDIAISLVLDTWNEFELDCVEGYLSARAGAGVDSPFKELKETYGYAFFKDQMDELLIKYLDVDAEQAAELRKDLGVKMDKACNRVKKALPDNMELAERIIERASLVTDRTHFMHLATLIYEVSWLKVYAHMETYPITIRLG